MPDNVTQSIIDIVKSCEVLQLCTFGLGLYPETRHVMNEINFGITDLDLRFFTTKGSPKYQQIQANPHVCLYYFNPNTRHVVRLFGLMEIINDHVEKQKYWKDPYKRFGYDNNDMLTLLRFAPKGYKFYVGNELHHGEFSSPYARGRK